MLAAPASTPASADHGAALAEGQRVAAFTGRAAGSGDVLLGLVRAGGAAGRLLGERGVTSARLESLLHQVQPEPAFNVDRLARMSHEIAQSLGARQTSSLHLLMALLRFGGGAADLLRLAGQDAARLRAVVLRALTGPARAPERSRSRSPGAAPPPPRAPPPAPARTALPAELVPVRHAPAAVTYEPTAGDFVPVDPPASPVLYREREIGRLLDLLQANPARVV